MKPQIKEMIVVEGKSDTQALNRAVIADTIETNGSAVSLTTIKKIILANQTRGIIVFTDPDFNGNRIRQIVQQHVPNAKQAFLPRQDAQAKHDNPHKSLGVEHASIEAIQAALKHVMSTELGELISDITTNDLYTWELIGTPLAKKRREQLGDRLNIGYGNAKQFQKRIQQFAITKSEIINALQQMEE